MTSCVKHSARCVGRTVGQSERSVVDIRIDALSSCRSAFPCVKGISIESDFQSDPEEGVGTDNDGSESVPLHQLEWRCSHVYLYFHFSYLPRKNQQVITLIVTILSSCWIPGSFYSSFNSKKWLLLFLFDRWKSWASDDLTWSHKDNEDSQDLNPFLNSIVSSYSLLEREKSRPTLPSSYHYAYFCLKVPNVLPTKFVSILIALPISIVLDIEQCCIFSITLGVSNTQLYQG